MHTWLTNLVAKFWPPNLVLYQTGQWMLKFSDVNIQSYLFCWQGVVKVGAVDADAHQSLGAQYGVRGFPTIKIFGADKNKPEDYQGRLDFFLGLRIWIFSYSLLLWWPKGWCSSQNSVLCYKNVTGWYFSLFQTWGHYHRKCRIYLPWKCVWNISPMKMCLKYIYHENVFKIYLPWKCVWNISPMKMCLK